MTLLEFLLKFMMIMDIPEWGLWCLWRVGLFPYALSNLCSKFGLNLLIVMLQTAFFSQFFSQYWIAFVALSTIIRSEAYCTIRHLTQKSLLLLLILLWRHPSCRPIRTPACASADDSRSVSSNQRPISSRSRHGIGHMWASTPMGCELQQ